MQALEGRPAKAVTSAPAESQQRAPLQHPQTGWCPSDPASRPPRLAPSLPASRPSPTGGLRPALTPAPVAQIGSNREQVPNERPRSNPTKRSLYGIRDCRIIIIAVAAGLGLVADQRFSTAWLPVASAMVLLGAFGAVATRKCFERWFRHWTRAYAYREQLFDLYPEIRDNLSVFSRDTLKRTDAYEAEADERFRVTKSIRLH